MSQPNDAKPIIHAINSIEDAKKMDEMLLEYSKKHAIQHPTYLSLAGCWARVQNNKEKRRIFTAVFDLKLSLVMVNYDALEIETAFSKIEAETKDESIPILSEPLEIFFERFHLHRSTYAYIICYRAIFDKLMGLMILMHSPGDYTDFISGRTKGNTTGKIKSRKAAFRQIVEKHPTQFPKNSVDNLIESIQKFDDDYRTSEVHCSGTLRKHTFGRNPDTDEYFGKLRVNVWNYLIAVVREIDKNIG